MCARICRPSSVPCCSGSFFGTAFGGLSRGPRSIICDCSKRGRRPESFRHGLNTQGHLHSALVKIVKFTCTNRGPYTMGALV